MCSSDLRLGMSIAEFFSEKGEAAFRQVESEILTDLLKDRISRGHRFLGHDVTLAKATDYVEALREQHVLVDFEERRTNIRQQLADLASAQGWQVPVDEDLLEEVTAIVEWPTVFYGDFEEKYLSVPHCVLITAMRDHQRYFYALDAKGELLPVFISVRNGNDQHLANVVKGNQKV